MQVTWGRFSRYSVLLSALTAMVLGACGGGGGGTGAGNAPMGGAIQGTALALSATGATSTVGTSVGIPFWRDTDGTGVLANFVGPTAAVADGAGNLYVADKYGSTIRKVVIATGAVTTVAGQAGVIGAADGTGTAATFSGPRGITTDGTSLYVVDSFNNKIRKITPASGTLGAMTSANAVVTSLTGPPGATLMAGAADSATASAVTFNAPYGIAIDSTHTNLYVADFGNNKIRKVVIATGATSSLTGPANVALTPGAADSATATAVAFNSPAGITTDGTNLYVADYGNNKIRTVVIATGATTSLTGPANATVTWGAADGAAAGVSFSYPSGIATDGVNLYVADSGNNKMRQVVIATGATSSLTGTQNTAGSLGSADGPALSATFNAPAGVAFDGVNLYVADGSNDVRQMSLATGQVSTLAGAGFAADGTGAAARFGNPDTTTTDGVNLYVTDCMGNTIRKVVIATGAVTTLAGQVGVAGSADGTGLAAAFTCPRGITTDGAALYVADLYNNKVRKIAPSGGSLAAMTSANAVVTTLAGSTANTPGAADGTGTAAAFNQPHGITTDGAALYVADSANNKIRKIAPPAGTALSAMTSANAAVTSLTGPASALAPAGATDGSGAAATFSAPLGITTDGAALYVVDSGNNKIRKIAPPAGTALGAMTRANAAVSSLTGTGSTAMLAGAQDGPAAGASFSLVLPFSNAGITTDGVNLYITDYWNAKIRMISPPAGTALSAATGATAVVSSITGPSNAAAGTGFMDGAGSAATFYAPCGITTDGKSLYVIDGNNATMRQIR